MIALNKQGEEVFGDILSILALLQIEPKSNWADSSRVRSQTVP